MELLLLPLAVLSRGKAAADVPGEAVDRAPDESAGIHEPLSPMEAELGLGDEEFGGANALDLVKGFTSVAAGDTSPGGPNPATGVNETDTTAESGVSGMCLLIPLDGERDARRDEDVEVVEALTLATVGAPVGGGGGGGFCKGGGGSGSSPPLPPPGGGFRQ